MLAKLLNHLRGQYLGAIALFVALGGTGYAAANLPSNSVGTKQLRNGAVTNHKLAKNSVGPRKLDPKFFAAYPAAYAQVTPDGKVLSARPAVTVIAANSGAPVPSITLRWRRHLPPTCFGLATTVDHGQASSASVLFEGGTRGDPYTYIALSSSVDPVNVVIFCPRS